MKFLQLIANVLVICINIAFMYFIITGLYGYFVAYSNERKEKWLLATLVWIFSLVIVDSIYFLIKVLLLRRNKNIEIPLIQDSFFFRREEFSTQIVYGFKKSAWICPILGIGFILYFLSINLQILPQYIFYWLYGVPTIIYILISFISHLTPNKEIKEATKKDSVKASGLKFSINNPIVVVVKKGNQ